MTYDAEFTPGGHEDDPENEFAPNRAVRDLTALEYITLGLISLKPQSGYSIMNYLEMAQTSGGGSPGTVYPILKRLEKQGLIIGTLETDYETRPRKVYALAAAGQSMLDDWLREVPQMDPIYEQRELAIWRFQFMENRLTRAEIIAWIDGYLDAIRIYEFGRRQFMDRTLSMMEETGQQSLHRQLVMEASIMELNTLRSWLEMARVRILAASRQSGDNPTGKSAQGDGP